MDDHKHLFSLTKMSETLGVSRSGYYRWAGRGPSKRELQNRQFNHLIKQVWLASGKTYGSPRIHRQLLADGESLSRPRVARLMRQMGIASEIRPKWVATTDSAHSLPVAPNVVDRAFDPPGLGQIWVSDITYLPSREGWLYLTTVMDLADRQIIGWSLADGMAANQTSIPAFRAACKRRPPPTELLFHSDRGVQYACGDFTDLLDARKLTQSMSRKGNCWDNAPAESFFKTFKTELPVDLKACNYRQARAAVFAFIEVWYNRKRLHSTLDYQTPAQMEQYLTQTKQIAA